MAYCEQSEDGAYRGPPRTTLPVVLAQDLRNTAHSSIKFRKKSDIEKMRNLAMDRGAWKSLIKQVMAERMTHTESDPLIVWSVDCIN